MYFNDLVVNTLVKDQQKQKGKKKSVIEIEYDLKYQDGEDKFKYWDYNEIDRDEHKDTGVQKWKHQLNATMISDDRDWKDRDPNEEPVDIKIDFYPYHNLYGCEQVEDRDRYPKEISLYETLQKKEVNKLFFLELKILEFRQHSLRVIQINIRNVIALWAEALGLNRAEEDEVSVDSGDGVAKSLAKQEEDENKNRNSE